MLNSVVYVVLCKNISVNIGRVSLCNSGLQSLLNDMLTVRSAEVDGRVLLAVYLVSLLEDPIARSTHCQRSLLSQQLEWHKCSHRSKEQCPYTSIVLFLWNTYERSRHIPKPNQQGSTTTHGYKPFGRGTRQQIPNKKSAMKELDAMWIAHINMRAILSHPLSLPIQV